MAVPWLFLSWIIHLTVQVGNEQTKDAALVKNLQIQSKAYNSLLTNNDFNEIWCAQLEQAKLPEPRTPHQGSSWGY